MSTRTHTKTSTYNHYVFNYKTLKSFVFSSPFQDGSQALCTTLAQNRFEFLPGFFFFFISETLSSLNELSYKQGREAGALIQRKVFHPDKDV